MNRVQSFFNRFSAQIAVRNGIGGGLAWFLGTSFSEMMQRPSPVVSALWCVMTTILVLQAHLGGTYRAAWTRFLGLLVGTLIGAFFTTWIGADPVTLGISVALTIMLCSCMRIQESFRIATATVAVIMILRGLNPEVSAWTFSVYRFVDSCLGIFIAVVVAHLILPLHARKKMRLNMAEALQGLARLYRIGALAEELNENQKKASLILIQNVDSILYRNRQILEDSKPELLTKSARISDWALLNAHFDSLFEKIIALRHVYHPNAKQIFDEALSKQFDDVVKKINIALHDISEMLTTGQWVAATPDLSLSLQKLKEELARFRSTKSTRQFNLDDVESFFVFFYSLKSILDTLNKMEVTIGKLISKASFG